METQSTITGVGGASSKDGAVILFVEEQPFARLSSIARYPASREPPLQEDMPLISLGHLPDVIGIP